MFLLFVELIELPCLGRGFNNNQVDGWNEFMNSIPDLAYNEYESASQALTESIVILQLDFKSPTTKRLP